MDLVEQTIQYAETIFLGESSGHDMAHTMRVFRMATALAQIEGADLQTVQLAALLHDADDRKLSPETCETNARAVSFLQSQGCAQNEIDRIVAIIRQVSFRGTDSVVPSTLEGKCVQDADRLDALGAIGIARAFAFGGSRGRKMHDPNEPPQLNMDGAAYAQHESTTINHFYEKLLHLRDLMTTAEGRRIAEQRHCYMVQFLQEFSDEWEGKC